MVKLRVALGADWIEDLGNALKTCLAKTNLESPNSYKKDSMSQDNEDSRSNWVYLREFGWLKGPDLIVWIDLSGPEEMFSIC